MKRNKIRFTFITIIIVILSGVNLILFSISGGEESDYSYNPTGKRDPFRSFLFDIGFSREGFRRLSEEELQNLKIDLITYEYIKKNDPNMYKEISRYERFFKDLDAFKELTAEERRSEIEKYKELRIDANSKYKDVVFRHPLTKIGLSSLKMVGIILGGLGNSALIETEDSRGYTIKKGMALGLNNGIVTDINSNGLIVEERYVDYLGNVIAEIIDIKLQREEG